MGVPVAEWRRTSGARVELTSSSVQSSREEPPQNGTIFAGMALCAEADLARNAPVHRVLLTYPKPITARPPRSNKQLRTRWVRFR